MSGPTRICVLGAGGRLGRSIVAAARADAGVRIAAGVEKNPPEAGSREDFPVAASLEEVRAPCDVVVDATAAEAVSRNAEQAVKRNLPYVLAVTGLSKETREVVRKAGEKVPIVVAPNLSLGVAVLTEAAAAVAKNFPGCEIEIVEAHHKAKKDKPSGTALALADAVRPAGGGVEAAVHSLRGGDVVGEHRIFFLAEGERIELAHAATSRAVFARGALAAARFLVGKKPGIYGMRDVLGLARSGG